MDSLFPEARRLERRRHLRFALLALLAAVLVVGVLRTGDPSGGVLPAAPNPSPTGSSVKLPAGGQFSSLAVVGGRLLVLGGPEYSLAASGYQTSLSAGRAVGTCHVAAVDPRTLVLGRVASANCGDPTLYGENVLPIDYWRMPPSGAGVGTIDVRIARTDPAARAGYTLGPVVTSYPQCSDCQIAWAYGDGSLWLYNPLAGAPHGQAALLRISTRTGAVLERWKMPEIVRALLAADAQGLWLSPSIESGTPGRLSRSQRIPYESLYRIVPGEPAPQRVLAERGGYARWLVASGKTTSAAVDTGRGSSEIWSFAGLRRRVHGPPLNDQVVEGELGTGAPTVAGNTRIGFYTVVVRNGVETVIRFKPDSRREQTGATFATRAVTGYEPSPPGVALDGSFFFVDPPMSQAHGSELHRVTPP